jgi:hypothetical protein
MSNFIDKNEEDQTISINSDQIEPKSINARIHEPKITKHKQTKGVQFSSVMLGFLIGAIMVESWMQSDITLCNKNREFEIASRTAKIAQNQQILKGKKPPNIIKPLSKAACYQKTTPLVETHKWLNKSLSGVKKVLKSI